MTRSLPGCHPGFSTDSWILKNTGDLIESKFEVRMLASNSYCQRARSPARSRLVGPTRRAATVSQPGARTYDTGVDRNRDERGGTAARVWRPGGAFCALALRSLGTRVGVVPLQKRLVFLGLRVGDFGEFDSREEEEGSLVGRISDVPGRGHDAVMGGWPVRRGRGGTLTVERMGDLEHDGDGYGWCWFEQGH